MKNSVNYSLEYSAMIEVGTAAIVKPINHTGKLVSNKTHVLTSKVLRYDKVTGIFETENSLYYPR